MYTTPMSTTIREINTTTIDNTQSILNNDDVFNNEFLKNNIPITSAQKFLLSAGSSIASLINPHRLFIKKKNNICLIMYVCT